MIRDFIEVLDIVYQNPEVSVKALLGSQDFHFAKDPVGGEETGQEFAEFDV